MENSIPKQKIECSKISPEAQYDCKCAISRDEHKLKIEEENIKMLTQLVDLCDNRPKEVPINRKGYCIWLRRGAEIYKISRDGYLQIAEIGKQGCNSLCPKHRDACYDSVREKELLAKNADEHLQTVEQGLEQTCKEEKECPEGQVLKPDGTCGCPGNQILVGGKCGCPAGHILTPDGTCKKEPGFWDRIRQHKLFTCGCYQHCVVPYAIGTGGALLMCSGCIILPLPHSVYCFAACSTLVISAGTIIGNDLCTAKCSETCNLETETK